MTTAQPSLRLRPITAGEYPALIAASRAGYAHDIEVHGGMPREAAEHKADADIAAVLPQGPDTPGHSIYQLESGAETVGRLWVAEREMDGRRVLYIYEIEVDEPHRGRGFGRQAMLLAEAEARARGISTVQLNVFGGNEVARGLYRSLGYRETAVQMTKDLA